MFQVLNLTELELNRVDVRVGLSGALYYMDGSSQAVRQLRGLVSQVASPLKCIFCFNLRWLFLHLCLPSYFFILLFYKLHVQDSFDFRLLCLYFWVGSCLDFRQVSRNAWSAGPILTLKWIKPDLLDLGQPYSPAQFFGPMEIFSG